MRRYSAGVLLCYWIETADTKNLWLRKYMNHNLTEVHTKEDTLQSAQKTVLCVVWRLNKIWHCASLPICQEDNSEMWPFLWRRSQIYSWIWLWKHFRQKAHSAAALRGQKWQTTWEARSRSPSLRLSLWTGWPSTKSMWVIFWSQPDFSLVCTWGAFSPSRRRIQNWSQSPGSRWGGFLPGGEEVLAVPGDARAACRGGRRQVLRQIRLSLQKSWSRTKSFFSFFPSKAATKWKKLIGSKEPLPSENVIWNDFPRWWWWRFWLQLSAPSQEVDREQGAGFHHEKEKRARDVLAGCHCHSLHMRELFHTTRKFPHLILSM